MPLFFACLMTCLHACQQILGIFSPLFNTKPDPEKYTSLFFHHVNNLSRKLLDSISRCNPITSSKDMWCIYGFSVLWLADKVSARDLFSTCAMDIRLGNEPLDIAWCLDGGGCMNFAHARYMKLKTWMHLTKIIFKIECRLSIHELSTSTSDRRIFVCTADFSYRPLFHYRFLHHVFSHSFVRFFFHTNCVDVMHTMRFHWQCQTLSRHGLARN